MSLTTCEALVTRQEGGPTQVKQSVAVPAPGEGQGLVKVSHAAQNPTDVQSLDGNAFGDGAVLGCDFVGTVEATGPGVTRISKGMTIAGLIWGGEIKGLGAYGQYTLADQRICFQVPAGTSLEEASTVPLAATTSLLALFSKDCLNISREGKEKTPVLIWGGSSSVGLYAIQIAAMYGLEAITTCSPHHADHVRSLGASHVFDYNDDNVVEKIRAAAPALKYVFDTIGTTETSGTSSRALCPSGGTLCTVRPGGTHTEEVVKGTKITYVLVWTAFLKEHRYGDFHWPPNKEDHALASEFFDRLPALLQEGKLKPNRTKVFEGGLDDVPRGFQEHRDGKISGYKIVYKIA